MSETSNLRKILFLFAILLAFQFVLWATFSPLVTAADVNPQAVVQASVYPDLNINDVIFLL